MKFIDNEDVQYLLDFAIQNKRDFSLNISAGGDVNIDVSIPSQYKSTSETVTIPTDME